MYEWQFLEKKVMMWALTASHQVMVVTQKEQLCLSLRESRCREKYVLVFSQILQPPHHYSV